MTDAAAPTDLDWVQMNKEIRSADYGYADSGRRSFGKNVTNNPFVPIGCLVTMGALTYGLWSFRKGQMKMSQNMMRLRIAAQGFTLTALIVGIMMTNRK